MKKLKEMSMDEILDVFKGTQLGVPYLINVVKDLDEDYYNKLSEQLTENDFQRGLWNLIKNNKEMFDKERIVFFTTKEIGKRLEEDKNLTSNENVLLYNRGFHYIFILTFFIRLHTSSAIVADTKLLIFSLLIISSMFPTPTSAIV